MASDPEWVIAPEAERALVAERLLPGPVALPVLSRTPPLDLVSRSCGALIGGAIGDALGRPGETRSRQRVRAEFGHLTDFVPWPGYRSGPVGTITDDTQLTIVVAQSLVATRGILDPTDLAARYADWLEHGRGMGVATSTACRRLQAGEPWWTSGTPSAGNGAAMRSAPIGIVHCADMGALRRTAAFSAVPTHRDPTAVAGAIVHAAAVAWLVHRSGPIDPVEFVGMLEVVLADVYDPGVVHRGRPTSGEVALVDRIREIPGWLGRPPDDVFDHFYNGALVTESLPCALWCFLEYLDDPETAVVTAASGGHDSDTIAAMTGAYVGALRGEPAFPSRWRDDVEYADLLRSLAGELAELGGFAVLRNDDAKR